MLLKLGELSKTLQSAKELSLGCIVDTNIIFAVGFELDHHNEWAENVFKELYSLEIPIFTNLNVRSEFIELNRRVLIPECLLDFYDDKRSDLPEKVEQKLKSLRTSKSKALLEGKTFRFSEYDIKQYRSHLSNVHLKSRPGPNLWELFCKDYLHHYITNVWEDSVENLKIQFLGTRAIESRDHFNSDPTWADMVDIIGKTGIGSSDAMIVNLFMHSKLPLIVTTDSDVKDSVLMLKPAGKFVLAPN